MDENRGTVYICTGILSGRTAGRSFYVQFRTVDGDAVGKSPLSAGDLTLSVCLSPTAPNDYTSRTGSFYIDDGTSSQCYSISIVSDSVDEEEECFVVSISTSSSRGLKVNPQVATVCINDDDGMHVLDYILFSFYCKFGCIFSQPLLSGLVYSRQCTLFMRQMAIR